MTTQERDDMRQAVIETVNETLPKAVYDAMPEALGEALGPLVNHTVAKAIRRYVVGAAVGYVILALGLGYAIHDGRVRGTRARAVLCRLITKGDSTLYAYHREGLLNDRQLRRALRQSAESRRDLGPAPNCVSMVTGPPAHVPPVSH
jgi:hypothetical protein